jgi:hypothetical protein
MKRFYHTPLFLALGLGLVFLLPHRGTMAETSLSKTQINIETNEPPISWGEWSGQKSIPSKKEKEILANDTNFIKGDYTCDNLPLIEDAKGQLFRVPLNLSIVISGHDINNSIHRPERCLVAQGHNSLASLPDSITTPDGRKVNVQRITTNFPIAPAKEGDIPFPIGFVSYYFFVGHRHITHSHWERILIDMKDRLLRGTDQQWSFVMVSMPYNLGSTAEETESKKQAVDKKIRQFLAELTDRIVQWDEIKQP